MKLIELLDLYIELKDIPIERIKKIFENAVAHEIYFDDRKEGDGFLLPLPVIYEE